MTVKYPTIEELKLVGEEIGLQLSDADAIIVVDLRFVDFLLGSLL